MCCKRQAGCFRGLDKNLGVLKCPSSDMSDVEPYRSTTHSVQIEVPEMLGVNVWTQTWVEIHKSQNGCLCLHPRIRSLSQNLHVGPPIVLGHQDYRSAMDRLHIFQEFSGQLANYRYQYLLHAFFARRAGLHAIICHHTVGKHAVLLGQPKTEKDFTTLVAVGSMWYMTRGMGETLRSFVMTVPLL